MSRASKMCVFFTVSFICLCFLCFCISGVVVDYMYFSSSSFLCNLLTAVHLLILPELMNQLHPRTFFISMIFMKWTCNKTHLKPIFDVFMNKLSFLFHKHTLKFKTAYILRNFSTFICLFVYFCLPRIFFYFHLFSQSWQQFSF